MTPEEARTLAVVGRELFRAARGDLRGRMCRPRAGDLVLEVSGLGRAWDPDQIGRLIRVDGEDPYERYIVAPLHDPEREQGWSNAAFIALPTERSSTWLAE